MEGILNDAQHKYIDKERVAPGETVNASLRLLRPDLQQGRLFVGMPFTVQEGSRIVGNGTILRVIDPRLEQSECKIP
jgi:translation elongation factor EF-Tu-like GTPase